MVKVLITGAAGFIGHHLVKVQTGQEVIIHADRTCTKPGSRFYIDAENVADGVLFVLANGVAGEKYNIVGEREMDNLELADRTSVAVGKPLLHKLIDFHSQRPGHDLRYALNGGKLARMGWTPPCSIEQSIEKIVKWTLDNPQWLVTNIRKAA